MVGLDERTPYGYRRETKEKRRGERRTSSSWRQVWGMGTGLSALWGMGSCSKQRLAVDRHPGGVITHRHPEGVTPIYETWLFRALVELGSKEQDPETLRLSSS
ncbi:MAG: hypothetical protein II565_12110 [Fibrobacter sp.]|nr:hypothetical protein [Fibrobacter sp.]